MIRRLAVAKVRELRRSGMSFREIGLRFGNPATPEARTSGSFAFRLPPERLLAHPSPSTGSDAGPRSDDMIFLRALDALDQGLAFFDCAGTLLHTNRAVTRVLESSPSGGQLRQEIQHFAASLCGLVRIRKLGGQEVVEEMSVREIPTEEVHYRLRGSFIGIDLFGQGSSVLVTLERPAPEPLSDQALRERFGLTRQECRIARLLVEGRPNAEIARRLFISPHTARHHTEHVLRKLGACSRAEVAGRLLRS